MLSTKPRTPAQQGYSLVEALVVVAIIGLISVVTVPNFISLYRAGRIKSSVRNFNSDLRAARQRAVARYRPVKVTFSPGANTYAVFEGTRDPATKKITWDANRVAGRTMEQTVSFFTDATYVTFADQDDPVDGFRDIVFKENGTIETTGKVFIRTDFEIPKNFY